MIEDSHRWMDIRKSHDITGASGWVVEIRLWKCLRCRAEATGIITPWQEGECPNAVAEAVLDD